jgi:hypothetical protein
MSQSLAWITQQRRHRLSGAVKGHLMKNTALSQSLPGISSLYLATRGWKLFCKLKILVGSYCYLFDYSGHFSAVVKGIEKASDKVIVAKLLEIRPETEAKITREFEALRSFRNERIASLLAAYKPSGKRK